MLELCAIDFKVIFDFIICKLQNHFDAISKLVNILFDICGAEDYILGIPYSSRSQTLCHLVQMIVNISARNQVDNSDKILEIIERHTSEFDLLKVFFVSFSESNRSWI